MTNGKRDNPGAAQTGIASPWSTLRSGLLAASIVDGNRRAWTLAAFVNSTCALSYFLLGRRRWGKEDDEIYKPADKGITAAIRRYPVVRVSTELDAPAGSVWAATKRSATLVHVARGMLGFAGTHRFPEGWREGDLVRTRLVLFNLLPAWAHELRIVRVDEREREILSNERDALAPVWNHRIKVEEISSSRCRYTDEIEIRAGLLTPLVWSYAHLFYRYRQRRWRGLARSLEHGRGAAAGDSRAPLASPQTTKGRPKTDSKWLLDGIRRFNRSVLNPLMLSFAGHRGRPYSVVRHEGRRSGKEYRIPVVAMPIRGGFIIPLPYGPQTDWLRNVRAAGQFTLEQKGLAYRVGGLDLIGKAAAEGAFPRWLRGGLRHTEYFLKVKRLPETGLEQAAEGGAPPR